jgi:hypothetical protein
VVGYRTDRQNESRYVIGRGSGSEPMINDSPLDPPTGRHSPEEPCRRCAETMEFRAIIPRFDNRPTYRIFQCQACGVIAWVET